MLASGKIAIPTEIQIDLRQALRSNAASQSLRLNMRDEGGVKFQGAMARRIIHEITARGAAATNEGQTMRSPAYYVTILLLAFTSEATFAADASHGSALARRWCASCHVISSAQRVEIDHSPSFASIAQRPDFSAEKLALFLLEPHPKMPDTSLSHKEADDLAAYIAEQRP